LARGSEHMKKLMPALEPLRTGGMIAQIEGRQRLSALSVARTD
jgi:hypothetical protein